MKVLVDLQHPAHLHFFRNLIVRLQSEEHIVRITGRNKEVLVQLAENYGIGSDGALNVSDWIRGRYVR